VFFLYGVGSNGKSVYIETLTRLLGDYAVTIPARVLLKAQRVGDAERATPFLITLHGRRLATCSELSESMPIDESVLKDLNGGDLISGRENYGKSFQFRNTARMLVRCNHLPTVTGTDKAVWDRIRAVPFTTIIQDDEQNPDLAAEIAASELPGVLVWAHAGLMRLAARGYRFDTPKAVLELTSKHRTDSDVLGSWLNECVVLDPLMSGSPLRELQPEVTKDYTDWAHQNNHHVMSSKTLWLKLRERLAYDPIYRGDGGAAYAKGFTLRRTPTSIVKLQNDEISKRDAEIERLKGELAAATGETRTTSTTRSGKEVLRLIAGSKT
jgi:putative DNA primase/helicase